MKFFERLRSMVDGIEFLSVLKGTATVLLVLFVLQAGTFYWTGSTENTVRLAPVWVSSPGTLKEALELSDLVVTAKVKRVVRAKNAPGPPEELPRSDRAEKRSSASPEPGAPKQNPRGTAGKKALSVPNEVIRIKVNTVLKGSLPEGSRTVDLYHLGKSYRPVRVNGSSGKTILPLLKESPPYRRGERYVLFLTDGPTMRYEQKQRKVKRLIAPEGRYRITPEGLNSPVDRGVAAVYNGKSPGQLIRDIQKGKEKSSENTE